MRAGDETEEERADLALHGLAAGHGLDDVDAVGRDALASDRAPPPSASRRPALRLPRDVGTSSA